MEKVSTTRFSTSAAIITIILIALAALWAFGGVWGKLVVSGIVVVFFAIFMKRANDRYHRRQESQEDSE